MAETELNVEQKKNLIHKLTSPVYLGVGAVIFGLLFAPLGLLLAIITIYKAGQQRSRLPLFLGVLGIVAVAVGVFGLSRIQSYLESNRTQTYTYGNLAEHKVFLTEGSGISFSLPPELLPKNTADPRQTKAGQANFTHTITARNGRPIFISRQSVFVGQFSNQNFDLDGTLKDPNNKEYKPFTKSLTKIVESQNGAKNVVFSGSPQVFTNQNISESAWTINFTGELAQPSQAGKNDKLKGVILVAKGKNATSYQMSILTVENNWQSNERTWQRILDSVKIDQ